MEKFGSLILIAVICALTIVIAMFGGCLQPRENFFDEDMHASAAANGNHEGNPGDMHASEEARAQTAHVEAKKPPPMEHPPAKPSAVQAAKPSAVQAAKVHRANKPRPPPVLTRKPPAPAPEAAPPAPPPNEIEGFSGDMYAAV